ncbi:hypothetical protein BDY19DRAFT_905781 [Irpex rosettiformis]|uniref:Uncharacterized protein n=1 Tax=Irpex rosettiformis TaxID=378272 RepID=A0ACB8U5L6_9APHY|nr:hypothetical protein BDY19DRAFT_905781 [Irpex rosettiformis]
MRFTIPITILSLVALAAAIVPCGSIGDGAGQTGYGECPPNTQCKIISEGSTSETEGSAPSYSFGRIGGARGREGCVAVGVVESSWRRETVDVINVIRWSWNIYLVLYTTEKDRSDWYDSVQKRTAATGMTALV